MLKICFHLLVFCGSHLCTVFVIVKNKISKFTGLHSAVGNVSDYRCASDCRSKGLEFNPRPVPYFHEIDHEIISTVILLPSADSFKKGCCQLQALVCAQSTG